MLKLLWFFINYFMFKQKRTIIVLFQFAKSDANVINMYVVTKKYVLIVLDISEFEDYVVYVH